MSGLPSEADRIDPDRLARLERVQGLFCRLLFCARTQAAWRADPDAVLADWDLDPSVRAAMPDVDAPAFKAEAHGRQSLVRREVDRTVPRTRDLLVRRAGSDAGEDPLGVTDFLSSDAFYDPAAALPHTSGVGPGYENATKFLFWFRRARRLAAPGADIELRTVFYCDFAAYLMGLIQKPAHPYFRRFTGGVYWPRTPGVPLPVHLVTDKLALLTLQDEAKVRQLPMIGLQNLDTVRPGDWEVAENI